MKSREPWFNRVQTFEKNQPIRCLEQVEFPRKQILKQDKVSISLWTSGLEIQTWVKKGSKPRKRETLDSDTADQSPWPVPWGTMRVPQPPQRRGTQLTPTSPQMKAPQGEGPGQRGFLSVTYFHKKAGNETSMSAARPATVLKGCRQGLIVSTVPCS